MAFQSELKLSPHQINKQCMRFFSKKDTYTAKVLCMNCIGGYWYIEIQKGKSTGKAENEMDKTCPNCGTKSLFIAK